ncbi:MAG: glycerol kinase GlpK [Halobacteriovoraceae bacterium]|jgi:glycerol kinase|nr:glycerol kinase GlpK [Halobacteriovoraceae bacterium]MBT5095546.1 glycerol kinase GlpK [Halobacteriovoraceae bacterium]
MGFILAIDQGTTGTTAALIDSKTFAFIDKANLEYPQIYPQPGWVEHDLDAIWKTVGESVRKVLEKNKTSADQIVAIGITNQRETTCAFNTEGIPLAKAIVWQDRRTGDFCQELKDQGKESLIKEKTGLPIDPYFSGTKMRWLLNNNQDVKKAAAGNQLKFGNIDTFLLYKLSAGASYATEASNASRTLLMDLKSSEWDSELLSLFSVPLECLPEIKDSFGDFGSTSGLDFLPDGIPITGILGDQQAALFGQAGYSAGDMKCTYGTGAFILINTGEELVRSSSGLLTTVAYKKEGQLYYALEGAAYIAGAAVQWLRDNLKIIPNAPAVEALAKEVKDLVEMENIMMLPFFTGIGSPYWISDAQAALVGLTRDSGNSHIARACLDGIALSINDLIEAMGKDSGNKVKELKVDGGAVANDLLMTIQATVSQVKVIRPKVTETTAYGAALAAGIGANLIKFSQISELWKEDSQFESKSDEVEFYQRKAIQWKATIQKLFL